AHVGGAVAQVEWDGHVRIGDLQNPVLRAFGIVARQISGGETRLRIAVRTYATAPGRSGTRRGPARATRDTASEIAAISADTERGADAEQHVGVRPRWPAIARCLRGCRGEHMRSMPATIK